MTLAAVNPPISSAFDFQHHPLTPIALTTFVICISIAILCDVDLQFGSGWIRGLLEGAVCGAAMLVALIIFFHQLEFSSAVASQISPWLRYGFPFSIGFFWGAVAPHLYRVHRREIEGLASNTEFGARAVGVQ